MFVGVERYLVDLEPLVGILAVELALYDDAGCRLLVPVGGEVEHHDLALEIGEATLCAVNVGQVDVDNRSLYNLVLNGAVVYHLWLARMLHSLDGNVLEVLGAIGLGVEEVEVGGYGSKATYVVACGEGIEDEAASQTLEESEVGVGFAGGCVDILHTHAILILLYQRVDTCLGGAYLGTGVAGKGEYGVLQLALLVYQALECEVVVRPLYLVGCAH